MSRGTVSHMHRRFILNGLVLAAALTLGCGPQEGAEMASGQMAYIDRLGTDTIRVEVYQRTPERIVGDLLVRTPVTRVAHYEASLSPEGTIERLEVEWSTPEENPEGPAPVGYTITMEGDSATIEVRGGRNPGLTRIAVPEHAIPTVGANPITYGVLEQAIRETLETGTEAAAVGFIQASRGRVAENTITRFGEDTLAIDYFGSPVLIGVSDAGQVLWRSGQRTTNKLEGERAENVSFETLAAEFAERDARGEGLGVASPEATVEAEVEGANISIVYSRPAQRGREIWGGTLVPWNEVWRTGANAATSFTTDRDLEIGGVTVPAGDYTLFSLYTPTSAKLIVNQQTGQWGTAHDPAQDLARIDMRPETLSEPLERFTIAVEESDSGGVISLAWGDVRYSVPFTVR